VVKDARASRYAGVVALRQQEARKRFMRASSGEGPA
jgi:hypothetical protein